MQEKRMRDDVISRQAAIDAICMEFCGTRYKDCQNPFNEETDEYYHCEGCYSVNILNDLPSAQPEPDWDYSEETKQITLIVPEDVYNSAETIFLSVGYEGTFGIRGMVYSAQPERCSDCIVHGGDWECDHIHCRKGRLPSAYPEIKPIEYRDCANAMLKMWIDNVLTDGEYNRIMDKLNSFWKERREDG